MLISGPSRGSIFEFVNHFTIAEQSVILDSPTDSEQLIRKKVVIFIFGDGPDVSRIARNLLFGIDKLTITNSLNFGGFWTFSIFSWFFRHVHKVVEIFFPPKKSGNFSIGDRDVSQRPPAIVRIPEIKNSDRRLFPECRDIVQLPTAQKLQLSKVGKNIGKFPETGPLKLEEFVTISNN